MCVVVFVLAGSVVELVVSRLVLAVAVSVLVLGVSGASSLLTGSPSFSTRVHHLGTFILLGAVRQGLLNRS